MDLIIDNKIINLLNADENGVIVLKSSNNFLNNYNLVSKLSQAVDKLGELSAKVVK